MSHLSSPMGSGMALFDAGMSVIEEESSSRLLILGSVIPLTGTHLQFFLDGADGDGPIAAVGIEIRRAVGNDVLAAQFILDGGKGVRYVFGVVREECTAAGGVGKLLQHFVTPEDKAAVIG